MLPDETASLYFDGPHFEACLDTAFAVVDSARSDVAVGRAFAVPFAFGGAGREELPDSGWDGVIRWAHEDQDPDVIGRISAIPYLAACIFMVAVGGPRRERRRHLSVPMLIEVGGLIVAAELCWVNVIKLETGM